MEKIFYFIFLLTIGTSAQVKNKIEGLIIESPCELFYTRNIGDKNNYSCNYEKNGYLINYSVLVSNVYNETKAFNKQEEKQYHEAFLNEAKLNAERNKERTKYISFNGKKALVIEAYLNYSDVKLKNTLIVFFYKKKNFIANIVSNDFEKSNLNSLLSSIKLK
ncbi:hypothetical protein, partial [Tenacibaculum sp. L6]|uniref:hypothetical protein n=1 Tax=Tenacibaculum sp. L6 TaxID=2992764 RepID=UPI00237AC860